MDVEWSWSLGLGLELTKINHRNVLSLQLLLCFVVLSLLIYTTVVYDLSLFIGFRAVVFNVMTNFWWWCLVP